MDSNHCQVVENCINGARPIDEQSLSSMMVLGERLERLKKLDSRFNIVEFSPVARRLAEQKMRLSVC
ncbi:hypothetical protein ACFL3G_05750 [Planctomycetota bacterium]